MITQFYIKRLFINLCIVTTIVIATYINQKSNTQGQISETIFTSFEASVLQCLHRCKLVKNNAVSEYNAPQCKCLVINEDKSGTIHGLFVPKVIPEKIIKREINIALEKAVTSSGFISDDQDFAFIPQFANDGVLTTTYCSSRGGHSWWSVDFKEVYLVHRVVLHLNSWAFSVGAFYKDLTIKTRERMNGNFVICKTYSHPPSVVLYVYCEENPTYARNLMVSTNNGEMYLVEVQVFTIQ